MLFKSLLVRIVSQREAFGFLVRFLRWMEAEKACEAALGQHKSVKGHWRRAQARKAQGRIDEAVKGMYASLGRLICSVMLILLLFFSTQTCAQF